ncbi:related to DNA repair protein rad9 [Sporisorium reilianum SRZ2]|uniref:Related to DNA repair protein rad9 n=1 Tax=Sporisorium reilianum (strain SRZ2) TaxID=999809 RepID=E6ZP50_SPORE|nr:related to DNA repair protein rad9 [Sporisorium reilianum SRZ2]
MNALISASDIKTFYSALHCLSRFSETFWLQCSPRTNGQAQIRLSAINPTNSAFCMFAFDPDFFLSVSTESNHKIECQIQLKTILSILRTRGRNVERLSLTLTTNLPCRFTLTLHCHHSILKTHHLTYEPKRGLLPTADPNPPHFFCLNPQTASEWLDHFLSSSRTGEITLHCTPHACIARSKEEEMPESRGSIRKAIATEVKVAVEEFKEYCVLDEVKLTFSLREFKATVGLAEGLGVPLEVNFSEGDEPLFVRLRVESAVAAEFVIATTRGDRGGSGDADSTAVQPQPEAAAPTRIAASVTSSAARSHPSRLSEPSNQANTTAPPAVPHQSTPLPHEEDDDDATQPLFFPGASQLSLQPTPPPAPTPELAFVQPTPVAQGGDPGEFLDPHHPSHAETPTQANRSDDDDSDGERHAPAPRKRFKPLF